MPTLMNKKEEVIFLVDVEGIARRGEVKEVGKSFAENFLFPKQKALAYNKTISKQLQYQRTKFSEQQALRRKEREEIFTVINQKKLNFFLKEKEGETFGSITTLNIIKILKEKFNVQITKKNLPGFKPLRRKGDFFVEVKVGEGLSAQLRVIVDGSHENAETQ